MEGNTDKINILLVDDNPGNLLSLETILQAPDRNLVRASSGEEALRYLLDNDAAVILLDVHMPNIGGLETAALIRGRERTRSLPIIFLTAYDDVGDSAGSSNISQGYSLGAVDYIIKPIDPEALKSKVAVFVELYRKTEQIKQQAELLREQNIEIENANLQRLSRLIDLGQELAAERDPEQVVEKYCDAARKILGASYASVGILEEDGVTLRHYFTSGVDHAAAIESGFSQASRQFMERRLKNNRSLRASKSNGAHLLPEHLPIKSFVGAPILLQGRARGWLFLGDKIGAPEFSEADERFTVTLTQAFVFYENARLYAELQRHAAELEQEIIERKQMEKALRHSEQRYRELIHALPAAVYTCDAQGRVTLYNEAAVELWGREPEAERDLWCGSLRVYEPDGTPLEFDKFPMAVAVREDRAVRGTEVVIERPDGSRRHVLPHPDPIHDASGGVIGAVNMVVDLTERKRAEAEREQFLNREQQARAEAEEANRLKDEFLATVSHELRAPLNAMLGWVTLARNGKLDPESKERALETVERNARAQKKLIDDLLDVSRVITGNLRLDVKPTDLASVIELAVESVRLAAEAKGVTLQTSLDALPAPFQIDPNRFQQVIWNLVYNAVKFTPSGGAVKVRLKRLDGQVEIEVIDTGIGIAPKFLPYVFDRFRQADGSITRKHGGLGLGLAIVRHLVEMHGGTVCAESEGEGMGATFRIRLPLTPPDEILERAEPRAAAGHKIVLPDLAPSLSGLRALVVDDQADVCDLVAAILRMREAEVQTASGVAEALNVAAAWQPEILISDIAMPGGDGYELIQRMRRDGRKIPAIALTAHASAEDRIRALAAGYQMHLPKPVEPYELVVSIASLTGRLRQAPDANGSSNPSAIRS